MKGKLTIIVEPETKTSKWLDECFQNSLPSLGRGYWYLNLMRTVFRTYSGGWESDRESKEKLKEDNQE